MNAFIAPMIQHDFVTKKEFGEFKNEVSGRFDEARIYVDDGFEKTNEHIDHLETHFVDFRSEVNRRFDEAKAYVDEGFEKTNEHIDNVEIGITKEMNRQFHDLRQEIHEIKDDMGRHLGQISEQSRHDLKLATEYLVHVINNRPA